MFSYARVIPSLAATFTVLALAGCGGSGDTASNGAAKAPVTTVAAVAPATPTAASAALAVASPADGSLVYDPKQLSAAAGALSIAYANPSPVPHNIAVEDSSGKLVGSEIKPFAQGERTLKVTLKAGTYTYYCSVPGHRQAGMAGTLTVK